MVTDPGRKVEHPQVPDEQSKLTDRLLCTSRGDLSGRVPREFFLAQTSFGDCPQGYTVL